MAATLPGPAAYILLLPATFPELLACVVAAVPAELGPEPLDWPATAPPETSRPPHLLLPVSSQDIRLQHFQGFLDGLLTWLHSIPIVWGL